LEKPTFRNQAFHPGFREARAEIVRMDGWLSFVVRINPENTRLLAKFRRNAL
jgi:hypothetical protein